MTPLSQTCGEKQWGSAFKVDISENLFNAKKHLALALKKNCLFTLRCVFQTKLNEAINIFCRLPEWIGNVQMIPSFSTRLGWERGWKSCVANSKNWRFEK